MSKSYNMQIERGSTKVILVEHETVAGDIIDLTNYESRMHVREEPDSSNFVLALHSTGSTANASTLNLTPSSGSIQIYISAADTDTLIKDVYFYDLEIYTDQDPYSKSDTEYVKRLLEGVITTKFNVTR